MKDDSSPGWQITKQTPFSFELPSTNGGAPTSTEFSIGFAQNTSKPEVWAITFKDVEGSPAPVCNGPLEAIELCYEAICHSLSKGKHRVTQRVHAVLKNAASLSGNYTDGDGNLRDLAAAIYEAIR